jgi:hypothetical protein
VEGDKGSAKFEYYVYENRFSRFAETNHSFLNEVLTTGSSFRFVYFQSLLADEEKLRRKDLIL